MFIKCNDAELIGLFESKPILVSSEEAGMFIYSKQDNKGMKLVLSFSVYERKCTISLGLGESTALEMPFKDVAELSVYNDSLRIHQNQSEKDCVIHFKPHFFINFETNKRISSTVKEIDKKEYITIGGARITKK